MYELSRVRLFSVGPPGARYQDVCLDLRGVGEPVAVAPQADLFGPDNLDGVPRRPSPASVLFLENGGGKSVLLKLVFSVLLPGRRQVVGTTNTRVLEKFVLGEDVAHVALEWMHTVTGERIVTGKVSEWRGHVVSADPAKLIDAWYSFHPTEGFGLDELPFTLDRRRVTLAGFRERLDAAHQGDPSLRLVWESVHRDWSTHLVELGLDPELFRYQRAMNAGEGEAAEAFAFPSDEAFVDFLLRAVTDPEEPRGLAEVVAGYAAKITQRADLELERQFVEGTLRRLAPLAEAEATAAQARAGETSALRRARSFAASIAARHRLETERLRLAEQRCADTQDAERAAVSEQRRQHDTLVELRRRVAVLRCQDAEEQHQRLRERREEAAGLVAAWQAVEPVLRDQLATAEASRLRRVVAAEQDRANPVLHLRQEAAAALAAALRSVIDAADRAAASAGRSAASAAERAEAARAEELHWAGQSAEHRAGSDQARASLGRIARLIDDAVRAGLLAEGDDPEHAATEAAHRETATAEAVERTLNEHASLRGARRGADERFSAARADEVSAAAAAEEAAASLRQFETGRAELAEQPRLAELLGVREVQPELDAPALLQRLASAVEAAEEERARLRAACQRDSRAVRTLGEGGLLPVPEEIEQALGVLDDAGIVAHSGWRYLSRLPEARRESTIERAPQLVAGIVLDDPADVEQARERLSTAQLLPCTIIAVGSAEAVRTEPAAAPGVSFVVPPNPAMFDEQTADRVRVELTERNAERQRRMAALETQLELDRALTERLRGWWETDPVRLAERLESEATDLGAEADRARARTADAAAEVDELDARAEALDTELPTLRAAEQSARAQAARLATLRDEVERRPELTELVRAETAAAEAAEAKAAGARQAAASAHREEQEQLRAQDRHAGVAATARGELAELPAEALELAEDAPVQASENSLSVLRAQYRKAEAAYAATEVDSDLRATLSTAEHAEQAARSAVHNLPDEVRARARELLGGSDGSDPASRRAATQQAERALRDLDTQVQEAHTAVALARRARDEFHTQQRSVAPYDAPRDVEHGEQLIERAAHEHATAESAVTAAQAHQQAAAAARQAIQLSVDGFAGLAQATEELAQDTGPAEDSEEPAPCAEDVDAATTRWTALRQAMRAAAQARQAEEAAVRKAADDVALHAQESQFSAVHSSVRRHILGVSRADMPGLAQDWLRALRPRLRSLDDDLANIGRHRGGIVTRLRGMVGDALRTLRLAQRLSQLPDGLSDWSGQQFLRIRFDEVDDETELLERLGEVVDRSAEAFTSGGKEHRDGMSLLLRGVRAAMPKGVRVEMLKPDAVLRAERLRVSEIRDVFSGGQQLTAAIVLYCTLAALRANQRGEGRRPHAGVLFLDNPIGRASASYLLELQFGVAAALGVQLVYTTGLFDAGALSAFPLIIRLRNDADLRAGRKYLTVDDQIDHQLSRLAPEDGTGQLSAARLFHRPISRQQIPRADTSVSGK
jgi:hypothetical protein